MAVTRMTFRLTTLLYLFALLASSMAVLGAWGLLVGGVIFYVWASPNCHELRAAIREHRTLIACLVVGGGGVAYVLYHSLADARPAAQRVASISYIKQLAYAIQRYHDDHGHFPPPYVTDDNGEPLYSWRAAILPYIEGDTVHKQFRYDEPWDSPNNRPLISYDTFQNPYYTDPVTLKESPPGETHYVAVVSDQTVWDPTRTVSQQDVIDSPSQTFLIIEVPNTGIHWSEPRDLTLDEAIKLFHTWTEPGYFFTYQYQGLRPSYSAAAFVDGSATHGLYAQDPLELCALWTRAGGELIPLDDRARDDLGAKRIGIVVHWGRIWGLVFWIAIILLPLNRRVVIFPTRPT
jgi:hypothetical protein